MTFDDQEIAEEHITITHVEVEVKGNPKAPKKEFFCDKQNGEHIQLLDSDYCVCKFIYNPKRGRLI